MNCAEADTLIHALLDNELDAGHTREIEAHLATCAACTEKLEAFRALRTAVAAARLKEQAPASLRQRLNQALPSPPAPRRFLPASWRSLLGGFAGGTALSAAVAATLLLTVIGNDRDRATAADVVSAHLRSLQAGHLTDVATSDQHAIKPWFNGRLDVAPPVIDLTAQGFTLIGGRLDYIEGDPAASVVYRRRNHVINLFVRQHRGTGEVRPSLETVRGFNVRHWTEGGFELWAVSDINAGELEEFGETLTAAMHPSTGRS
jgi:mycothiol system anti-sigma-R factor